MRIIHPLLRCDTVADINKGIARLAASHCSMGTRALICDPFTTADLEEFLAKTPDLSGCQNDPSEITAFRSFVVEKIKRMEFFSGTRVADWDLERFERRVFGSSSMLFEPQSMSPVELQILDYIDSLDHLTMATCSVCRDHVHVDFGDVNPRDLLMRRDFPDAIRIEITDNGADAMDAEMRKEIATLIAIFYARLNLRAAAESRKEILDLGLDPEDYT